MNNKFFSFLDPFIEWLDDGRFYREPFKWVYVIFAIINLLLPFVALYAVIESGYFRYISQVPAKIIIGLILAWLIVTFACWLGFQLWWNRKDKVVASSAQNDDFVATPVFCHFIQTFGEWMGLIIAVIGGSLSLLVLLVMGGDADVLSELSSFLTFGAFGVIVMPLYGFLIVVVSRFLAEQGKALATIANNTRRHTNSEEVL